jgi:2-polyprenyl-3-methyl-5-hydroxy-6-metoxy-1,4-benzoquinol methylase
MIQKLGRVVPGFLKPYLRPLYQRALDVSKRLRYRQQSRTEVHGYWRRPPDAGNFPTAYLEGSARSQWLVELARKHLGGDAHDAKVLEIGCNIGRNLEHFHRAGFRNLSAIEINEDAVKLLREHFPEMGRTAQIHVSPVEEIIKTFGDNEFDLVYSMAVLEHVHTESEWVFAEIARVAKRFVITIEDERDFSDRHFPRNYGKIFTALGLTQVESTECTELEGLGRGFFARVFRK